MKYKALVIDLDGTLVGRGGSVSPANVAAVKEAFNAGIRVSISTGRMPKGCDRLISELAIDGLHVFYDGALVCDIECRDVVHREPLERATALELVHRVRERKAYLELYTDDQYSAEAEHPKAGAHTRLLGFPPSYVDLKELALKGSVIKAEMVMLKDSREDYALLAEFREHFQGRLRFTVAASPVVPDVDFVNVVSSRVSKGEALRHLASHWQMGLESIAGIGDGDNDLPMLRAVGLPIAMGNATEAVKAAARHVTETVAQDGVASAIRRWILNEAQDK